MKSRHWVVSNSEGMNKMKDRSSILGGSFFLLIGMGAAIGSIQLTLGSPTEPQPGFFPFVGGIFLMFLSVILIVQGWMRTDVEPVFFGEVKRLALFLAVMVVFVAFLDLLGYVFCAFIASGLILRILKVKSYRVLILTSLCLSLGTYILFDKFLGIDLPLGILSRLGL